MTAAAGSSPPDARYQALPPRLSTSSAGHAPPDAPSAPSAPATPASPPCIRELVDSLPIALRQETCETGSLPQPSPQSHAGAAYSQRGTRALSNGHPSTGHAHASSRTAIAAVAASSTAAPPTTIQLAINNNNSNGTNSLPPTPSAYAVNVALLAPLPRHFSSSSAAAVSSLTELSVSFSPSASGRVSNGSSSSSSSSSVAESSHHSSRSPFSLSFSGSLSSSSPRCISVVSLLWSLHTLLSLISSLFFA